ncbi:hypothetical protein M9H77_36441 [Catharanthus roseus]|uniref:Uncharacterized protein n=1 Tax=Catharanthus roseus TaxID=4058 RepID=A0ACB9ZRT3_CATRO|nr:hypothetical protein M9H77_36441 [Catharanthus roseus]
MENDGSKEQTRGLSFQTWKDIPNFHYGGCNELKLMEGTTMKTETSLLEDMLELVTSLLMLNLMGILLMMIMGVLIEITLNIIIMSIVLMIVMKVGAVKHNRCALFPVIISSICIDGTGNNVYILRMNNKSCSCSKWQAYTLPCSHALVVCKENCTRTYIYVMDIYSRETYRRTYQSNFHPVGHENFWRDTPYNLTFHPPNMNNERGKKQGIRFRGKMDYRNLDSPPRCGRCCMPGHNRKNYNNPGSSNV